MINKHFYKKNNKGGYDFRTIELKNEHMETNLKDFLEKKPKPKPKDIHKLYGKYYDKIDPFFLYTLVQ